MKTTMAAVALVLSLTSSRAMAQERGGDAALGALSGAVVFGPIGAVAGAVVGYTAGPSIAHSWGLRRSSAGRPARKSARHGTPISRADSQLAPRNQASPLTAVPAPPPPPNTASTAPPVQALE